MVVIKRKVLRLLSSLAGTHSLMHFEQYLFNILISIAAIIILFFSLSKLFFGHYIVAINIFIMFLIASLLYYLSRVKNKFNLAITFFGILNYVLFGVNYFFNNGMNGPTAFIFVLTLYTLLLISPKKMSYVWLIGHLLVMPLLYGLEYAFPAWIKERYSSEYEYYIDYILVFIASLSVIYIVTYMYIKALQKQAHTVNLQNTSLNNAVSNLKQVNDELSKMDLEKTKLFSIISHDIRSPLTTIQSYLEYANMDLLEDSEREKFQLELFNLTKTSSEMLNNLIVWSNNQMNGVSVKSEIVYPSIVVQDVLKVQQALASAKGISISTNVPTNISIISDFEALSFIVRQVLNNAIKFSHQNSTIKIVLSNDLNGFITLSISDTGVGMSPAQFEQLFDLSVESQKGTSKEKGIGLGLYISYDYIKKLGGKIEVESTEGQGTTFHIQLPKK